MPQTPVEHVKKVERAEKAQALQAAGVEGGGLLSPTEAAEVCVVTDSVGNPSATCVSPTGTPDSEF